MSERRFWFVIDKGELDYVQDNVTGENITVTDLEDLLNELAEENGQLRQILKDIVGATDETYSKNKKIYKVTVVFDGKMYNQIRRCFR